MMGKLSHQQQQQQQCRSINNVLYVANKLNTGVLLAEAHKALLNAKSQLKFWALSLHQIKANIKVILVVYRYGQNNEKRLWRHGRFYFQRFNPNHDQAITKKGTETNSYCVSKSWLLSFLLTMTYAKGPSLGSAISWRHGAVVILLCSCFLSVTWLAITWYHLCVLALLRRVEVFLVLCIALANSPKYWVKHLRHWNKE